MGEVLTWLNRVGRGFFAKRMICSRFTGTLFALFEVGDVAIQHFIDLITFAHKLFVELVWDIVHFTA